MLINWNLKLTCLVFKSFNSLLLDAISVAFRTKSALALFSSVFTFSVEDFERVRFIIFYFN